MLPITVATPWYRTRNFTQQEWDLYFRNKKEEDIDGGWWGIIIANLAIIDPKKAWRIFKDPNYNPIRIDPGASRAWYLAFVAGKFQSPLSLRRILMDDRVGRCGITLYLDTSDYMIRIKNAPIVFISLLSSTGCFCVELRNQRVAYKYLHYFNYM
jgi:Glycosyl hydrolase family 81 C-terminal domain